MRGKHKNRPKKIPISIVNSVHEHIKMFPCVESHYCRKNSDRNYLSEDLSISEMHRMYIDWMTQKNEESYASEYYYRYIFNNFYNLFFFKPKKDQCDRCFAYKNSSAEEQKAKKSEYEDHRNKSDMAKKVVDQDVKEAKIDDSISCTVFDLQKVLSLPQSEASVMYYKRKLSLYNFTLYNLVTREVLCNVWNETIAGKGSNEFCSCLWFYLRELSAKGKKYIKFVSDNCSYQNKNKHLFCMYIKASKEFNIKITHR